MAKDSTSSQLFEAVGRKRVCVLILEYFIAVYDKNRRSKTHLTDDDPELWLCFRQEFLADKFHCSVRTIQRHIQALIRSGFIAAHQKGGYDRSFSYELKRARINSLYQSMPLFDGIVDDEIEPAHSDKMSPSKVTKCHLARRQNVAFEGDKMSPCTITSYLPYNLPSSSGDNADAATKNNFREKAEAKLQPLQSSEGEQQEPYDLEKQNIIDRYRECDIAKEHAEAYIATYGIHLCKAVVCVVEKKKRKGEPLKGKGGGMVVTGLKNPACLGLEMDKQGQWVPAHLITKQMQIRATHSSVVNREVIAWEQLPYHQQNVIRDKIDAAYPDKAQAVRLHLYRKAALYGLDTAIASGSSKEKQQAGHQPAEKETQETVVQ